jgi:sugar phosphate isomerase/epimerase
VTWIQTGSSICFKPYTLEEALSGLSEAGFVNVEIGAVKDFLPHLDPDNLGPREIATAQALLEQNGLRCVSLSGHAPLHTEEGLARLTRVLEAGTALGILVLNTFTGDAETAEEIATFEENARRIADECQSRGIRLCIETDSNLLPTAEAGMRLLDEIGHDWIRINYDPGNVVYYTGADPIEDIKIALPRMVHFHFKDKIGGQGVFNFPPPGDGELDMPKLLELCADAGYSGPISAEVEFDENGWPDYDACLTAAHKSVANLRAMGLSW